MTEKELAEIVARHANHKECLRQCIQGLDENAQRYEEIAYHHMAKCADDCEKDRGALIQRVKESLNRQAVEEALSIVLDDFALPDFWAEYELALKELDTPGKAGED